jgi:hypothetical protein
MVAETTEARVSRVPWLTLYAVSMGFLESVVVVYLRELYYPDGFRFPVVTLSDRIATIELVRELTTLLMVLSVAVLAGRYLFDRFFVFAFVFGVWDIIYYVGLWVLLGWPESLFTWDVPVFYPVLISLTLIAGFLVHEALHKRGRGLRLTAAEWAVATAGAIVVIVAFCWNWRAIPQGTVPTSFPVGVFALGWITGSVPFLRAVLRSLRHRPSGSSV